MRRPAAHSGFTLMEVMVAMTMLTLLAYLVGSSVRYVSRFYQEVSTQSRTLGNGTMVMDKIQNLCFGLPKQALETSPGLLTVQPLETLGATGEAVYSDRRVVISSTSEGVQWWTVMDQPRDLGVPLKVWPVEPGPKALKRTVLGPGWSFNADFTNGRFPLMLRLDSPTPNRKTFERTLSGYL